MIYLAEDLFEEMYKRYPEVKPKSIKKICKKGLTEIRKHAVKRRDIEIVTPKGNVIFFIPQSPEAQRDRVALKLHMDKFVNEKANRK